MATEFHNTLVEDSPDTILIHQRGKIVYVNPAGLYLSGATDTGQLIGKPIWHFLPPDQRERVISLMRRNSPNGRRRTLLEVKLIRLDGREIYVDVIAIPITYRRRQATQMILRDITQQKQWERRLERLNACFLSFGRRFDENINRLVETCGELMQAGCAFYYRGKADKLHVVGKWRRPPAYPVVLPGKGYFGGSVMTGSGDAPLIVRRFSRSAYAGSDGGLLPQYSRTAVGFAVRVENRPVGALCVWYREDRPPNADDLRLMNIIAVAIGVEEARKKAKEALRESEERFRVLVDASFDGVFIHRDNIVLEANQAFARMVGEEPERVGGRDLLDYIAPETREILEKQQAAETREIYEVVGMSRDGHKFPMEVVSRSCQYDNRPAHISAVRDISERVQTAVEIQSQLDFSHALNRIAETVIAEDDARVILERAARILGETLRSDHSLIYDVDFNQRAAVGLCEWRNPNRPHYRPGRNLFSLDYFVNCLMYFQGERTWLMSHFRDPNELLVKDNIAATLHEKLGIRNLLWFPFAFREDGFYLMVFNQLVHNREWGTRELEFLAAAARQLSIAIMKIRFLEERRAAENALAASEKKYRTLFEESKDFIFISTPDGRFLDVNSAGMELLGYSSREDLLAVDISRDVYVDPGQREDLLAELNTKGHVIDFESVLRRRDGERVIVLETVSAVTDEDGEPVSYRGIMRDITERKNLEQQLLQAHKMEAIGTLAGGIAHDFNNILAAIINYTEASLNTFSGDHAIRSNLKEVFQAALRGRDMVRQILTFSRQTEHKRELINIESLAREALKLMRASLPNTIELQLTVDKECGAVLADPTQIHQVIMNLCANAYHAMDDKNGRLDLIFRRIASAEERQRPVPGLQEIPYICLTVRDNGHGIDPAVLERIFDPFFTTKAPGEGTGMGLSVVHGIVQAHHGLVTAASEPGVGTEFHVYLPEHDEPRENKGSEVQPAPAEAGGGEHVLLLDDEEPLVRVNKQILEVQGYRVTMCTNALRALDLFRDNPQGFDLVITDQTMPHMSGLEVARALLEIRSDVPVILVTGFRDEAARQAARDLGVKDYMLKPVLAREMTTAIRRALEGDGALGR